MQTEAEKIVTNQGTISSENGLSVPNNAIDLDTDDAQKAFADAFNAAAGIKDAPATVVETPAAVVQKQEVVPDKEEEVKEATTDTTTKAKTDTESVEATKVVEDKKDDPYSWLASLPTDIQEKVRKEIEARSYHEHRFKSEVGRQNALQQKSLRLERELADLRSQVIKPQDPTLAAAAKSDSAKSLAEWNTLIEADPNLAKAIEARVVAERSAIKSEVEQQLKAQVDPLYQHSLDSFADRERQMLQQEVPNYMDVISSPVYSYWISNVAAPGLQQLANNSNDHRDAITVLKAYAADAANVHSHLVSTGQLPAPIAQQQQAPVKQQTEAKDTSHADKVAQSRQQKVQAAPVVPTSPNPIATPSANSLGTSRPGDSIDVEDQSVLALFEDAYKKNSMARR